MFQPPLLRHLNLFLKIPHSNYHNDHLSKLIRPNKLLEYLGRNSLILMGLNGFYFQFINTIFVNQGIRFVSGSSLSIFIFCGTLTCISLLLCIPFILLLGKYLPQLTGKPKVEGPILPSLIH